MIHRLLTARTLPGAADINAEQEALLAKLLRLSHITRRLDETILFPLVGFKNSLPHWRYATSPPLVNWPAYIQSYGATPLEGNYPVDIRQRDEVYHQRVANLVRQELTVLAASIAAGNVTEFSKGGFAIPIRATKAAYAKGRRELRGKAEPVREEMWVGVLRRAMGTQVEGRPPAYTGWGLWRIGCGMGIRMSSGRPFENVWENVNKWGKGVAGAEGIKDKFEIRWVDGRDYGIVEGDVEGARKHFMALHENNGAGLHGLNALAFLVADESCIDSNIHGAALPGQTLNEADMGPFILVGRTEGVRDEMWKEAGE
ncbi:hypothetical protein N0V88_008106 [Collariella sp. IMI 366227]|nr:hypothetical protein N0V88_008106 [Collariella sp. IMI 366227]